MADIRELKEYELKIKIAVRLNRKPPSSKKNVSGKKVRWKASGGPDKREKVYTTKDGMYQISFMFVGLYRGFYGENEDMALSVS